MEAWYAVNTKPHSELRANSALNVRGFETYLPMLPPRQGSDSKAAPLFPAYLFVRCELESVGIDNLQYVPGLRRIVSFGGRPAVVPDAAVEMIREQMQAIEAQGGLPRHSFKPGDEVVIDKGPLAGLRGIFQGPLGPAERVEILIRFLGQANRAQVPVELLRAPSQDEADIHRRRGTRGHGRRIRYQPGETQAAEDGVSGTRGPRNGQLDNSE